MLEPKTLLYLVVAMSSSAATAVSAQTEASAREEAVLPEVPVVAPPVPSAYKADRANTATKTDTAIRDTPASIQVVPREVIEDQQALRLDEAVRNVSGAGFVGGSEGQVFLLRGFPADVFENGFPRPMPSVGGFVTPGDFDTGNIERVEVLKGPASVLYGRGNPDGLINLLTKKPLADPYYSARFTAGSFDLYRPSADISGPLNRHRTARYRLNAAYESARSFRDIVESQRALVAPAIALKMGPETDLTIEGQYADIEETPDAGVPRVGGSLVSGIPRSRFLGEPTDREKLSQQQLSLILGHRFSDRWSLRSAFRPSQSKSDLRFTRASAVRADGRTVNRSFVSSDFEIQDWFLQNDLLGRFETGALKHGLLLGLELGEQDTELLFRLAGAPTIDLFNPVYGNNQPVGSFFVSNTETTKDVAGIYAQDQIDFSDRLSVVLGGRFDYVAQGGKSQGLPFRGQRNREFSPRAGIVYKPLQPVSLYAQASRSFQSQTRINTFSVRADGSILEPETAKLYETGVKTDLLGGRLSSTLALYQITKEDAATSDPANPGFSLTIGEQESSGVEVDIGGEVLPGWRVIAAYAYNESQITRDTRPIAGNRPANVPRNSASLWTTYHLQGGDWRGLGFGAGVFYVGKRPGDDNNSFELPGYARTDATVFYTKGRFTARLNVINLFDREFLLHRTTINFLVPGAPRTVLGSFEVRF